MEGRGREREKGIRERAEGRRMKGRWEDARGGGEGSGTGVSVELSSGTLRFYADSPETSGQFRN